jgi:four helix bundle protein
VHRPFLVARHYTHLVVWQLADEIRQHVFRWTSRPPFTTAFKAKGQIEGAANSVCHNIAEGFAGTHAEFARYLAIARRSLNEVRDCVRAASLQHYITDAESSEVYALIRRLFPAISGLVAYLKKTPDPLPRPGRPH